MNRSSKNTKIPNFVKFCLVEAEFFHADGQTDRQTGGRTGRLDEANSCFSKLCENRLTFGHRSV